MPESEASVECYVEGCEETRESMERVEDHILEEAENEGEGPHHFTSLWLPEGAGT